MIERQRRYFVKDKDMKALLAKTSEKLKVASETLIRNHSKFEIVETTQADIFLVGDNPVMFKIGEKIIPTLLFESFLAVSPKVVVDMGAVPHICKGANVMAPGIRRFEGDFEKGSLVFVIDEKHGKAIAVGEALVDSQEAKEIKQGAVVRNVHFVGDKIWNLLKTLL